MIRTMGPPINRFWRYSERESDCWNWTHQRSSDGYPRLWDGARKVQAHRFSYEYFIGPIPNGLTIDHLCRNRGCVNPYHLEPVTIAENTRRGFSAAAMNARKTHCIRGHPFDSSNLLLKGKNSDGINTRECRTCKQERYRLARMGQLKDKIIEWITQVGLMKGIAQ